VPDLIVPGGGFGGEVLTPDHPAYEAARRPVQLAYRDRRPRAVLRCRSAADVAAVLAFARAGGDRIAVRSGGHCFAGRSSTDGLLVDLSIMDEVARDGDAATVTIGPGARLGAVYAALHAYGRTLPAGCGPTVGIAGLTLGGGLGLLGRLHGLTCDRLVGAEVVLADGSIVECDRDRHADLFWALRGAGGGQFGVVTALRFVTVEEPAATRIEAHWPPEAGLGAVVAAWQAWAPDAPDEVTVNLTVVSEPGSPVRATLAGVSTLPPGPTRDVLGGFTARTGDQPELRLRDPVPYHRVKQTFDDPADEAGRERLRSEFFSRPMSGTTIAALIGHLHEPGTSRRRLSFTAMGGAYNRVAADATAFAHRGERFLIEHVGAPGDPWVDRSWAVAHADGSGRVYPNFPDPALEHSAEAYHGANHARLVAVKNAYDPNRFFDFPQAIRSTKEK
jgi:hypothetical protein